MTRRRSGWRRSLRHALRRFSARLLAAVLRPFARSSVESGGRLLVIRIDERVGNVLLTTPLLGALTDPPTPWKTELLVARSKASLVEGLVPLIPFEKKDSFRSPGQLLALLRRLRRARYAAVVDASHWHAFSLTSALLALWTGAPIRILHGRGEAEHFATHVIPAPGDVEYEVRTKLRLLEPLEVPEDLRPLRTTLGQGETAERMQSWLQNRTGGRVLGLAPGARKLDHRAPEELFVHLGRRARAAGWSPLVLWGPGEEALARRVAEGCEAALAPDTNLDELAALMRACAGIVANDTGPMHLSVACGVPTLGLFRSADPDRWGHRALGHRVVLVHEDDADGTRRCAEEALDALISSVASNTY